MKKVISTAIIILAVLAIVLTVMTILAIPAKEISKVEIAGKEIKVEVADSPSEYAKGLSGRKNMAEDEGMLFVFPEKESGRKFWMKDMNFPLDIIWISGNEIVDISKNVPAKGESEQRKTDRETDKVLEVNAGFCDKFGVKLGDRVKIR